MGELVEGEEATRARPPPQAERMQHCMDVHPRCFYWPDPRFWATATCRFSRCRALVRGPSGGGVLVVSVTGGGCDPARRRVFWPPCVWLALVAAEGMSAPRS